MGRGGRGRRRGGSVPSVVNVSRACRTFFQLLILFLSAYSSLLRITTAPPTIEGKELALDGDNAAGGTNRNSAMDALPTLGSLSLNGDNRSTGNNSNDTSGRSGLLGSIRPTFLRTLTGGRGAPAAGGAGTAAGGGAAGQQVEMTEGGVRPVPLDVESTAGLGRAGS